MVRAGETAGEGERALDSDTCQEAIEASGLIVALALDPDAKTTPVEATVTTAAPPPSTSPSGWFNVLIAVSAAGLVALGAISPWLALSST